MSEKSREMKVCSLIAALFTISTLFVLPFVFQKDYTNLFDIKYQYYYMSALATIVCFVINRLVFFARTRKFHFALEKWEIILLVFAVVCIISTLQSEFLYEAFWGNEGRYNGLFLMLLYIMTTLVVGRNLNMKQQYVDLFLIMGVIVMVIGIGDYFDLDILSLKHNIPKNNTAYANFTSTVGNINFYVSYAALVLGCCAGVFSVEKSRMRAVLYYLAYVIAFFGLVTGNSDSGYLAIGAILGLLPLYCLKKKTSARRYVLLLATSATLFQLIGTMNEIWSDRVIVLDSLLSRIAGTRVLIAAAVVLWIITGVLYLKKNSSSDELPKVWRRGWIGFLLLAALVILYVLYDVNIAGHVERYGSLENYLHFDDEWGTMRGYVWKVAWGYYDKFSPLHKVFGYGLETFPILTIYNSKWEMAYIYESFYDSVHNEYLQYLLGIGIVGVIAYVSFLVSVSVTLIRNIKNHEYLFGIVIALNAYWAQAVVNISTVNVAAVMWILMAIGMAACRNKMIDSEQKISGGTEDGQESKCG